MKKLFYLTIILIVISIFAGCSTKVKDEVSIESPSVVESPTERSLEKEDVPISESTGTFTVCEWKNYSGSIPTTNIETILPVTSTENDMVHILDTDYKEEHISENKWELPMSSGWRIDLNSMDVVGKTAGGDLIMATGSQEPLLVCIANSNNEPVRIFLNAEIAENGIASFDFSSFDIYYNDQLIDKRDIVERIWLYHVQDDPDAKDTLILDGTWEYYSLTLVHKECSALRYELNLGIYGDKLYMENIHRKYYVSMSLDQLQ